MINTKSTNIDRTKYSTFAIIEKIMHNFDKYKRDLDKVYDRFCYLEKDCVELNILKKYFICFDRKCNRLIFDIPSQSSFSAFPESEILVKLEDVAVAQYCAINQLEFNGMYTDISINNNFTWNDLYHQAIKNKDDFVAGYLKVLTYYYNNMNEIVLSNNKLINLDYSNYYFDAICRYQDVGMEEDEEFTQIIKEMFNNHVISLYDFNTYVAKNSLTSFRTYHEIENALGLDIDDYTGDCDDSQNDLAIEMHQYFPNCDKKHFKDFYAEMLNRQNWELESNPNEDTFLSITELIVVSFIANVLVLMQVPEWCQKEQILFTVIDWNYLTQEILPQFSTNVQKHLRPLLQMAIDIFKLSAEQLDLINKYSEKISSLNGKIKDVTK